tara:strand:- start:59 stop:910 length:852 start_codon:yes stop_codon:yes gene_type:complete
MAKGLTMLEDLDGRVAVVTGAASGIGLAMGEAFLAEGMAVVLSDVDGGALDEQVGRLSLDVGDRVSGVICDVADPEAVAVLAEESWARHGIVDVLCNNAGVGPAGPMLETTPTEWQWVVGVNLLGVAHGVMAFVPRMVEAGVGHVVNVASQAGLMTTTFLGMYAATKHAVVGLSEALYRELESTGVGVSCLCPELVSTGIFDVARVRPDWVDVSDHSAGTQEALGDILVGRGIGPREVASRVVDAMRSDRFWVFTHDVTPEVAARRFDDIAAGRNPSAIGIMD